MEREGARGNVTVSTFVVVIIIIATVVVLVMDNTANTDDYTK